MAAENAAASGNPVLIGGRYDSSDRTLGDGDAGAIALTDAGAVKVSFASGSSQQVSGMAAENAAVSGNPVLIGGRYDSSSRSLDDGDAGAMALGSNGNVLATVDGTVTANLSATDNAVLDTISSNTDSLAVTGGGVEASALRVTLASDSTGVLSIDDNGGSITVDGTVTANLSATDNAVLDTISSNTDSLAVVGGGVEATALRVTLASDSTGVLSVDDGGGSITVDGTVTANLSATDNAVLDTIETNTDSLTVTGGGVEASALRVTLASDSTGVLSIDDNGGSITVDGTVTVEQATHGSLQCNATMQIADSDVSSSNPVPIDGVETENAAVSGNPILVGGRYDSSARSLDDGDAGAVALGSNGYVLATVDGTVNLSAMDRGLLNNIEQNSDSLTVTGGGVEATALRVTLANDSTGVLSIDDNGGSITVDGEVTANLSATDNAVLDTIESNTDSLTVTGGGTQSGALRVTLASDSTGTLTVDGGETENAAVSSHPVLVGGRFDSAGRTLDDGDAGAIALDASGRVMTNVQGNVTVVGLETENMPVAGEPILIGGRYDSADRILGNGDAGAIALTSSGQVRSAVEGVETENAAIIGHPMLIGGRYDTSARSLNDGDAGAVALTAAGRVMTTQFTIDYTTETLSSLSGNTEGYSSIFDTYNMKELSVAITMGDTAASTNRSQVQWSTHSTFNGGSQIDFQGAINNGYINSSAGSLDTFGSDATGSSYSLATRYYQITEFPLRYLRIQVYHNSGSSQDYNFYFRNITWLE